MYNLIKLYSVLLIAFLKRQKPLTVSPIFVFASVQKSQNELYVSQKSFWILVFESILTLNK